MPQPDAPDDGRTLDLVEFHLPDGTLAGAIFVEWSEREGRVAAYQFRARVAWNRRHAPDDLMIRVRRPGLKGAMLA